MKKLAATILTTYSLAAAAAVPHHPAQGKSVSFIDEAHHSMIEMCLEMEQMQMTGNAEHDFAAMMIPHHQGAIDMAKAYLKTGTDPELRRMARHMIEEQEKEIQQLQNWLIGH